MTTVYVFGGPLKRDIVQLAFEECGQAGYEFELTPEEYDSALRRLNAMLAEWRSGYGIDLGYNFPNYGNGSPEDESGIRLEHLNIVASYLALRIAPSIGKSMGAEAVSNLARSFNLLRSEFSRPPSMRLHRQTPRGSGNRYISGWSPYFRRWCEPWDDRHDDRHHPHPHPHEHD